jgi:hypothetical protein
MNYQLFIHTIRQELLCALSPDIDPQLQHCIKNNDDEQDYISFVPVSASSASGVYPTLSLKPLYNQYCAGVSIPKIISDVLELFAHAKTAPDIHPEQFMNFDLIKDHICLKLISLKQNVRLLQDTPFMRYYDLALVCIYFHTEPDKEITSSALIKNDCLSMWGIDQNTLFEWATQNTPRLMHPQIHPIRELLMRMPQSAHRQLPYPDMYILTNEHHYLGAVCMSFPGVLEELAQKHQSDLILLPSSIHELIIIPANDDLPEDLNEIIMSVNHEAVEVHEQLADHYYYYDHLKKVIRY